MVVVDVADESAGSTSGAGPAHRRAAALLRRIAMFVGAMWLAGLATAAVVDPGTFLSWPLAVAFLAAAAAAWLGRYFRVISDTGYIISLAVIGLGQVVNADYSGAQAWVPNTVLTMAAITIGLLRPPRGAPRWIAGLAGLTIAGYAVALTVQSAAWQQWGGALIHLTYLAADGMLAAGITRVMLEVASRQDCAAAESSALHVRVAEDRQAREDRMRLARTVHDTVTNTLNLLRRGVRDNQLLDLRARCRDDLARIDMALAGPPTASVTNSTNGDLVAALREVVTARTAGSDLGVLLIVQGTPAQLPSTAVESACATVAEALNNAAKYAPGGHVAVRVWVEGEGTYVSVSDSGAGIGSRVTRRRLAAKYRDVYAGPGGLDATLETDEAGTTVTASWTPNLAVGMVSVARGNALAAAVRPTVVGMVAWLSALCLVELVVATWLVGAPIGAEVEGVALLTLLAASCVLAVWAASRRIPVSNWIVALLVAEVPLLTVFPGLGAPDCGGPSLGRWGPDAALLLLAVVAMLAGSLWWVAAGTALFVMSSAATVALLATSATECMAVAAPALIIDGAVLAAMVFTRVVIARGGEAAAVDYQQSERQRITTARERARAIVRETYLQEAVAVCRPLFVRLADGAVDPRAADVVRQAAVSEVYLRSMTALADRVQGSPLAAALARVSTTALHADVELAISTTVVAEPGADVTEWVEAALRSLVLAAPGAVGSVTLLGDGAGGGGGGQIALTGEAATGWRPVDLPVPVAGCASEVGVFGGWLSATFLWR